MKKIIVWVLLLYLIFQIPEVQQALSVCAQGINSFLDQFQGPVKPAPMRK